MKLRDELAMLNESWANEAYEKLRTELARLNESWASDAFIRSLPGMIGGSFADLGKVTFSAAGLRPADLIPVDFAPRDTTNMVTIESDADETGEAAEPDPPFKIELIVVDVIDDKDVVLTLAPKPDMSPREAFWLSTLERHYDDHGFDTASGSVLEWLRKRDLLRHFEVI